MGYKISKRKRIDLSHLGEDSAGNPFFVEIKNPKMMTYDEKMSFAKLASKGNAAVDEASDALKELAGSLILSWNLISIADEEHEQPVQIPSQDPNAFSKVPSEVIEAIAKGLGNGTTAQDEETKNSLAQSDKSLEEDRLPETSTSEDTTK